MNAVSYIRVSSTKQLDGDGPERQRAGTAAFPGFTIVREFIDDISGTKLQRPAFDEMLAYCAKQHINTILVDKTDRFTRDLFVGLQLIGRCAAAGLNVIDCSIGKSVTQPETAVETFVVKQLMLVAELNKNLLVETMASARKRKRDAGIKAEGPDGYLDLPEFLPAVQRARELQPHHTYAQIANTLTKEGYKTLTGKAAWKPGTVHRILKPKSRFRTLRQI